MIIAWLPVNQRWVLLFGDQIIDLEGQRFWEKREWLVTDLRYKGLTGKDGRVI